MFEGSEHPFSSYFGYSVNRAPGFWYVLTHRHFAIASIASIFALPMPEEPPERIGPWSFVASLVCCLKTGYPKSWWSWFIHDFPCKYCFILLFISIYVLFVPIAFRPSPPQPKCIYVFIMTYPTKIVSLVMFWGNAPFSDTHKICWPLPQPHRFSQDTSHQSPGRTIPQLQVLWTQQPAPSAMDQWTRLARKQQKWPWDKGVQYQVPWS